MGQFGAGVALQSRARSVWLATRAAERFLRSSLERSKRDHPTKLQRRVGWSRLLRSRLLRKKRSAARVASHTLRARLCNATPAPN